MTCGAACPGVPMYPKTPHIYIQIKNKTYIPVYRYAGKSKGKESFLVLEYRVFR
jgi:hypothetical protein